MAQHELKFLFVYLHSPSHADAPSFCRDVLTNPGVVSMLNDNFVCWGGDVRKSDAFQLATGVVASTFPYVALLSSVNSHNRPSLVMACEGAVASMTCGATPTPSPRPDTRSHRVAATLARAGRR